jgi:hypothetical protein
MTIFLLYFPVDFPAKSAIFKKDKTLPFLYDKDIPQDGSLAKKSTPFFLKSA